MSVRLWTTKGSPRWHIQQLTSKRPTFTSPGTECSSCGEPGEGGPGLIGMTDGRLLCQPCISQLDNGYRGYNTSLSSGVIERDASTRGESIRSWSLKEEAREWLKTVGRLKARYKELKKHPGGSLSPLKKSIAQAEQNYHLAHHLYIVECLDNRRFE